MLRARQLTAPGPTGTRGGDRGTTRHACAAPLRLGSTWERGGPLSAGGNGSRRPLPRAPVGTLRGASAAVVSMIFQTEYSAKRAVRAPALPAQSIPGGGLGGGRRGTLRMLQEPSAPGQTPAYWRAAGASTHRSAARP